MKTKLLLILLLFTAFSYSQFSISPKLYFDFPSSYTTGVTLNGGINTVERDLDAGGGLTLGIEANMDLDPVPFIAGIGWNFQIQRTAEFMNEEGSFNFMPVYATFKVPVFTSDEFRPMVVVNLGYNILHDGSDQFDVYNDMSGGLYWGVGARAEVLSFMFAELLFQSFAGQAETTLYTPEARTATNDVTYNVFSIGVGINIDLTRDKR